MFFLYELERIITLHPSFFGSKVREYLTRRLYDEVEGTCTGSYYIICVMDVIGISEGRIIPGNARAEYTIRYRTVVWRPFRGETVSGAADDRHCVSCTADASSVGRCHCHVRQPHGRLCRGGPAAGLCVQPC